MTVTGQNGNSMFLPFTGACYDGGLFSEGYYGCCWSGTYYEAERLAYYLYFYDSDGREWGLDGRYYGRSVRPVKDK